MTKTKAKQVVCESKMVGNNSVRYKDVRRDEDGWADASLFSPFPFDLVECQLTEDSPTLVGWFTGNSYVGLRFEESSKINKWRRKSQGDPIL